MLKVRLVFTVSYASLDLVNDGVGVATTRDCVFE